MRVVARRSEDGGRPVRVPCARRRVAWWRSGRLVAGRCPVETAVAMTIPAGRPRGPRLPVRRSSSSTSWARCGARRRARRGRRPHLRRDHAAGGALPKADLAQLNLAARVVDGARIAVPKVGEPPPAVDPGAVTGGEHRERSRWDGSTPAGPVDHQHGNRHATRCAPWHRARHRGGHRAGPGRARSVPVGRRSRAGPRDRSREARAVARFGHGMNGTAGRSLPSRA